MVLSSVLFFQLSRIFGDYLLVVPGWLFQGGAEPILVPWNTLNELIKCSCSVLGPEALQLLSSLRDVLKETRIIRFDRLKTILVPWNTLDVLIKCSCSVLSPEALQLLSSLRDVLKETKKN